jgi:hypothetical protein
LVHNVCCGLVWVMVYGKHRIHFLNGNDIVTLVASPSLQATPK